MENKIIEQANILLDQIILCLNNSIEILETLEPIEMFSKELDKLYEVIEQDVDYENQTH